MYMKFPNYTQTRLIILKFLFKKMFKTPLFNLFFGTLCCNRTKVSYNGHVGRY